MVAIDIDSFDIGQIAESGECFRMSRLPGDVRRYRVLAGAQIVEVDQEQGSRRVVFSCGEDDFELQWSRYFDLGCDYRRYKDAIPEDDRYLRAAAEHGSGIRMLWQDPWEAAASFVISQNCNIPRIRTNIEAICTALGEEHAANLPSGIVCYHAFPAPGTVAEAGEDQLRALGLGYRAPYVAALAEAVASGELDLGELAHRTDGAEVHARLLELPGVGPKVASCIELFGLHRLDAFPVDTWVHKIEDRCYGGRFPRELYAGFEGVMQQYLFAYALQGGLERL